LSHGYGIIAPALLLRYNINMFRFFPRSFFAAIFLVLILFLIPVSAAFGDGFQWAINGSILILASDNGKQGADPAPVLPSVGASFAWQLWGPLRIELTEDIYFTNYEYNSILGYPMACNPENRSAFVIGFVTAVQLTGVIPIGDNGIAARIYVGPAVDFRLVVLAFGLNHSSDFTGNIETDAQLQTDAIREYFWNEARWLLPVMGAGMDFPLNEKFLLGFDLRVWLPAYRLWTDKNIPAIDGWRFGVGFRITPRITSK